MSEACLCGDVPVVRARTEIVIVRHVLEAWKTTNTARIAALALPNARIVDYGGADSAFDAEALAVEGSWLLFPGAPHRPEGVPDRVVVLDGSWAQAKRMCQRIGALRRLPRWSIAPPSVPRRRLREAPTPDALSTLEAIASALGEIEGVEIGDALFGLHDLMVRRILTARGAMAVD